MNQNGLIPNPVASTLWLTLCCALVIAGPQAWAAENNPCERLRAGVESSRYASQLPDLLDLEGRPEGIPVDGQGVEKWNAGWTAFFDNDLFAQGDRDQDYTGGLAVTFAGRRAKEWKLSLDPVLGWIDRMTPAGGLYDCEPYGRMHAMQVGLLAFTPSDITVAGAQVDDRPYSTLLYASNSRVVVTSPLAPVYQSTFTFGVLGLGLAEDIQTGLHDLVGSEDPEGYANQISDGGEPTFLYSLARQKLLRSDFQNDSSEYELKQTWQLNVGYFTDISWSISGRWGRINTPWWSFTPERAEYASQPAPVVGGSIKPGVRERYVWAGFRLRARAYNVLLQGQFRDSEVTFSSGELEHLMAEAWIGLTYQLSSQARLSYVLRFQTSEIKDGPGSRNPIWGGLILSWDR